MVRIVTSALALLLPLGAMADTLKLAVTTSFHNSGLSDILLSAIQHDTAIEVQLLVVGTGFVSRGDDSGTHKKEQSLWGDAGLNPDDFGPWYKAVGAGMGATLNTASSLKATTPCSINMLLSP